MSDSSNFSEVVLAQVNPDAPLPTAVYLKVNGKFIKYKDRGDSINAEKYNLFISKGVTDIYIQSDEIMIFLEWINKEKEEALESLVKEAGEESRSFFKSENIVKEKIYETYLKQELTDEIVKQLQTSVSDFVSEINKNPITSDAIAALLVRNQTIADHSVNVANLAIYLAMVLGHGHQFILENVYMGAIFHDYGKAKIPAHVLENQANTLYSQAIQNHPLTGVKMISRTEGLPEPVKLIVAQHHEQFNGKGYPRGLSGSKIYEMAQVVSIANVFDNILYEHRNKSRHERNQRALKYLKYDQGKMWDPCIIEKLLPALKFAFAKEDGDK